mmetsp:Transcript_36434/g.90673  ORF Transcript_36434/g.90673 Transcript_36434/m.90673 type:complete len:203 (-) Transcript_36434:121-729(-)
MTIAATRSSSSERCGACHAFALHHTQSCIPFPSCNAPTSAASPPPQSQTAPNKISCQSSPSQRRFTAEPSSSARGASRISCMTRVHSAESARFSCLSESIVAPFRSIVARSSSLLASDAQLSRDTSSSTSPHSERFPPPPPAASTAVAARLEARWTLVIVRIGLDTAARTWELEQTMCTRKRRPPRRAERTCALSLRRARPE